MPFYETQNRKGSGSKGGYKRRDGLTISLSKSSNKNSPRTLCVYLGADIFDKTDFTLEDRFKLLFGDNDDFGKIILEKSSRGSYAISHGKNRTPSISTTRMPDWLNNRDCFYGETAKFVINTPTSIMAKIPNVDLPEQLL
jgi:hypothetical protein